MDQRILWPLKEYQDLLGLLLGLPVYEQNEHFRSVTVKTRTSLYDRPDRPDCSSGVSGFFRGHEVSLN